MALNDKQKRFANEYIIDLNATQAAIRAGYAERTAYSQGQRLLKNVEIQSYIEEQMASHQKDTVAQQEEILETLTSIMRGEGKGATLRGAGKGRQVIDDMPPTIADQIRAAELLGKRYAMWTDKQQIDGVKQPVIINDLED